MRQNSMNDRVSPDQVYGDLFEAVQASQVLGDSKSFVDAIARREPAEILAAYRAERQQPGFDLLAFVRRNFSLPANGAREGTRPSGMPIEQQIEERWDLLTRRADDRDERSSLIPLPNRYVVPGGRFREIYYWDSYFTMLGLAESGRVGLIRDMVDNFAWLIDNIGFIPNGNRTYYCSRSQPPFFALMVELLAHVAGDDDVYARYLPQLKQEYAFWMEGAETLSATSPAHRRVVWNPRGILNRYWDDATSPRPESYAEDVRLAAGVARAQEKLFRDVRAGAESGWDYSSRWFEDRNSIETIRTTEIVPVDLNALMYNLESTLARICRQTSRLEESEVFEAKAADRRRLLQDLFFDTKAGLFADLSVHDFQSTGTPSIATAYPLFFGVATAEQAGETARRIDSDFLKAGGWVTSNFDTGQQWDSPNGWAPMQWITYCGLARYGFHDEARSGGTRWVENNIAVYRKEGCLLEKYNVLASGVAGSGGEYAVQEGFGWTNAVLLWLMRRVGRP